MRITLEPTLEHVGEPETQHPKVSIEIPSDGLCIQQMWALLIEPALLAAGYSERTIKELNE